MIISQVQISNVNSQRSAQTIARPQSTIMYAVWQLLYSLTCLASVSHSELFS